MNGIFADANQLQVVVFKSVAQLQVDAGVAVEALFDADVVAAQIARWG
jgi:hypothetical protein